MLRLSRLAPRLAAPRVASCLYLQPPRSCSQVLYVSAVSLALSVRLYLRLCAPVRVALSLPLAFLPPFQFGFSRARGGRFVTRLDLPTMPWPLWPWHPSPWPTIALASPRPPPPPPPLAAGWRCHDCPAKLRCRFPSARFPGGIN